MNFNTLNASELSELLNSFIRIDKPWGAYWDILRTDNFVVKIILVNPLSSISLQSHKNREEYWFVLKGLPDFVLNNQIYSSKQNDFIYVPLKAKHRLINPSKQLCSVILEVQIGLCQEEDIIRYEDEYGRTN